MTHATQITDVFSKLAGSRGPDALSAALAAGDVFGATRADLAPIARQAATSPQPAGGLTLARLYLRQGHVREARAILRDVLQRDPADSQARFELERLVPAPRRLRASDLLAGLTEAGGDRKASPTLRLTLLRELLRRLQDLD